MYSLTEKPSGLVFSLGNVKPTNFRVCLKDKALENQTQLPEVSDESDQAPFKSLEVGGSFTITEDGYEFVTDNPKSLEEVII